MRLESLTPAAFVLGLGGVAVALYLLQRLRVRHRELIVVTTMFWHEAVEDTRARVLTHRFRHPLAYILALLIAGGILLALATPRADSAGERDWVVLLDTSSAAARPGRFEELTAELPALVERLPRDARAVLACGGETRTLLAPGEEALALDARLDGLALEPAPPGFERELARLARRTPAARPVTAILVGDAPVSAALVDGLPEGWRVHRATAADERAAARRAIRALGAAPAASGAWSAVDVLVELEGGDAAGVRLALDGRPLDLAPESTRIGEAAVRAVFRDVPARGELLRASFGDAPSAELVLPDRPAIAVALAPGVDPRLHALLAADPGVRLGAEAEAEVVLRRAGEAFGGARPALELVPESSQEETILLHHPEGDDSARVLIETLATLGLEPEDAARVARRTGRALSLGAAPATTRGAGIWEELLAPEAGFVGTRAFPACIAGLLRFVAGVAPMVPFAAVGEAVAGVDGGPWLDADGRALDAVGAAFVPPRAGVYESARGDRLAASLAAFPEDAGLAPDDPRAALGEPARGADLLAWVLVVVMALALVEWVLHQRGRMP